MTWRYRLHANRFYIPTEALWTNRSWWWLRILGRLSPGENLQQAQNRFKALAPVMFQETVDPRLSAEGQKEFVKSALSLQPATTGFSDIRTQYKTALFTLMAITGLVLLVLAPI